MSFRSLLNRLGELFTAKADEAVRNEEAQNVGALAHRKLSELANKLDQVKNDASIVIAKKKNLEREATQVQSEINQKTSDAKRLLEHGEEEAARGFASDIARLTTRLNTINTQLLPEANQSAINVNNVFNRYHSEFLKAQDEVASLVADDHEAEAKKNLAELTTHFDPESPGSSLSELRQMVNEKSAQADAQMGLADEVAPTQAGQQKLEDLDADEVFASLKAEVAAKPKTPATALA